MSAAPGKRTSATPKAEDPGPGCTAKLEKVWKQLLLYVAQWVFSVIAFGKTAGYSGRTHLKINCTVNIPLITEAEFGYPFRLPTHPYQLAYCDGSHSDDRHLKGDFSIPAEFFMCVGVITFLYCTVTLVFYMWKCRSEKKPIETISLAQLLWKKCSSCTANEQPAAAGAAPEQPAAVDPKTLIDQILMGVFATLWLVCSSMWARGVSDIKWATDPHRLAQRCVAQGCKAGDPPLLDPLYASVAFGFLCVILWILMIIHSRYCQKKEDDDNSYVNP